MMVIMLRIALLLIAISCSTAFGRLGETVAECETRYGPVVERIAAKVKESDQDACVFSKGGVTIIVEFKAGKAWRSTYRMSGMDMASVKTLLGVEAVEGGWSAPLKLVNQEISYSADHERLAVYTPGKRLEDVSTLVLVTKAYAKANRADYEAKLALIPDEVKRRQAGKPLQGL
jgi:hypothetical protein